MTADSWSICPKCASIDREAQAKAVAAVESTYGKVSSDDYVKARERVRKRESLLTTFCEDYELWLDGNTLMIRYSGRCQTCGFSFNLNQHHTLYKGEDSDSD